MVTAGASITATGPPTMPAGDEWTRDAMTLARATAHSTCRRTSSPLTSPFTRKSWAPARTASRPSWSSAPVSTTIGVDDLDDVPHGVDALGVGQGQVEQDAVRRIPPEVVERARRLVAGMIWTGYHAGRLEHVLEPGRVAGIILDKKDLELPLAASHDAHLPSRWGDTLQPAPIVATAARPVCQLHAGTSSTRPNRPAARRRRP